MAVGSSMRLQWIDDVLNERVSPTRYSQPLALTKDNAKAAVKVVVLDNFERLVLEQSNKRPVFVMFHSPTCGNRCCGDGVVSPESAANAQALVNKRTRRLKRWPRKWRRLTVRFDSWCARLTLASGVCQGGRVGKRFSRIFGALWRPRLAFVSRRWRKNTRVSRVCRVGGCCSVVFCV